MLFPCKKKKKKDDDNAIPCLFPSSQTLTPHSLLTPRPSFGNIGDMAILSLNDHHDDNDYALNDDDYDYDDDYDEDDLIHQEPSSPVIGAEIKAILGSATSFRLLIYLGGDDDDHDNDKCNWRIMTNTIVNNDKYNCNGWRDLHLFIGATIYLLSPSRCHSNICY